MIRKTNASRASFGHSSIIQLQKTINSLSGQRARPGERIRARSHGLGAQDEWPGWQNEFNATSSDTLSAFPPCRRGDRQRDGEREREGGKRRGTVFEGRQGLPFRTTDDERNTTDLRGIDAYEKARACPPTAAGH